MSVSVVVVVVVVIVIVIVIHSWISNSDKENSKTSLPCCLFVLRDISPSHDVWFCCLFPLFLYRFLSLLSRSPCACLSISSWCFFFSLSLSVFCTLVSSPSLFLCAVWSYLPYTVHFGQLHTRASKIFHFLDSLSSIHTIIPRRFTGR